jgi:hypothetical protein
MLTLHEALTARLVHAGLADGEVCWLCSNCGRYLCWYLGKLHFQCECHADKLKG